MAANERMGSRPTRMYVLLKKGVCDSLFNQHLYDPKALDLLIDSRLRQPLADCFEDEVEAIQTMHFFEDSEHPWHQDQYYLPDCMSAWIALVDVDDGNGPLGVQPGSHKGRLITKQDVPLNQPDSDETYEEQQTNRYFPQVHQVFDENGADRAQVLMNQGDVVLFNERLIHSGMPVKEPGRARLALACHYIPYQSENWDRDWPRISFDGTRRVHFISLIELADLTRPIFCCCIIQQSIKRGDQR